MTAALVALIVVLALSGGGLLVWALFLRQQVTELRQAALDTRGRVQQLVVELEQARTQVSTLQAQAREQVVRSTTAEESDDRVILDLQAGLRARRERAGVPASDLDGLGRRTGGAVVSSLVFSSAVPPRADVSPGGSGGVASGGSQP